MPNNYSFNSKVEAYISWLNSRGLKIPSIIHTEGPKKNSAHKNIIFVGRGLAHGSHSPENQLLAKIIRAMNLEPHDVGITENPSQIDDITGCIVISCEAALTEFKNCQVVTIAHPSTMLKNPTLKINVWNKLQALMKGSI